MRVLTLVRHAKASREDPTLDDFHRPLDERGLRDAPLMAQRLARSGGLPDRLVSSPALRALTTARLFADALGIPQQAILLQPDIYEASADQLLQVVRGLDEAALSVALFGHNPGLSDFCQALGRGGIGELPTCAVVRFELDVPRWSEVRPGCGRLLGYSFPKERQ